MGVKGLSSFVNENVDATEEILLRGTSIMIDANNLHARIVQESQCEMLRRADLFGGDLVTLNNCVEKFIRDLRACKVEPIFVFDGAQTNDDHSKAPIKYNRAIRTFKSIMRQSEKLDRIGKANFSDSANLPIVSSIVFRSVLLKNKVELIQCMFEADHEIAQLANDRNCPALSNDSDFFIFDIIEGVILIDSINLKHPTVTIGGKRHLKCSIYKIDKFVSNFPGLDKTCLPILSVLAGNDYNNEPRLRQFCQQLPIHRVCEFMNISVQKFHNKYTHQNSKIFRILHWLRHKSPGQAINEICNHFESNSRPKWKQFMTEHIDLYGLAAKHINSFEAELSRLATSVMISDKSLHVRSDEVIMLANWLRRCFKKYSITQRILEIFYRNILYIRAVIDDPDQPSANSCQYRVIKVLLTLLRLHRSDSRPLQIYDRVHDKFSQLTIEPMKTLPGVPTGKYCIYNIPKLPHAVRHRILVATFYHSYSILREYNELYSQFFKLKDQCEEFVTVKMLMDYIDREDSYRALPQSFKEATFMTMLYYFYRIDSGKSLNIDIASHVKLINDKKLRLPPVVKKKGQQFNRKLVHNINRLQSSVLAFNLLNGFLGGVMKPIRPYLWLNSCLIYNIASQSYCQLRLPHCLE